MARAWLWLKRFWLLVGGGLICFGAYLRLTEASRSTRFALLAVAIVLWAWSVRHVLSQPEPDFLRAGLQPRGFWVTVTAALGPLGALAYVIYALPRIVDARPLAPAHLPPVPEDRRAVWAALAWPYLDTDPDDATARRAATALLASGKPNDEIWRIDREEVAPALWNEGWYGDWFVTDDANDPVIQRIHARLHLRPRRVRWVTMMLTRPWTSWMSSRYRRAVQTHLEELHADA